MVLLINRCELSGKGTARGIVTTLVDARERVYTLTALAAQLQANLADDGDNDLDSCGDENEDAIESATACEEEAESGLVWPKRREDREWSKEGSKASKTRSKSKAKRGKKKPKQLGRSKQSTIPGTLSTMLSGPGSTIRISPGWRRALRNLVLSSVHEVGVSSGRSHQQSLAGVKLGYNGIDTHSAQLSSATKLE